MTSNAAFKALEGHIAATTEPYEVWPLITELERLLALAHARVREQETDARLDPDP